MPSNEILKLSIKELLSNGKYLIPIYQRNYDWGERESLQLIQDIADYASTRGDKNYYIGSLVVFVRNKNGNEYLETIDGQQRLTTLTILMNVLKDMPGINESFDWFSSGQLSYDHRQESDDALRKLYQGQQSNNTNASNIVDVFNILNKNILNILTDKNLSADEFAHYLLNNVIIIRIPVPQDTDLNHYFEIMNSRGEQLEKHEVLKAILMDTLPQKYHILFHEIWEACSSLSSYVQMNFNPNVRNLLFSTNWVELQKYNDLDTLNNSYFQVNYNDNNEDDGFISRTISQLFDDADKNKKYTLPDSDTEEDGNDRFGSIINFSNFLLHVLKVMYRNDKEYKSEIHKEIKLDDKRLVDTFSMVLSNCDNKTAFVERFIMALLDIRSLFDRYVIKRENYNGKDGWSLKNLKKYSDGKVNYVSTFNNGDDDENEVGKDIKMLEAMFLFPHQLKYTNIG